MKPEGEYNGKVLQQQPFRHTLNKDLKRLRFLAHLDWQNYDGCFVTLSFLTEPNSMPLTP